MYELRFYKQSPNRLSHSGNYISWSYCTDLFVAEKSFTGSTPFTKHMNLQVTVKVGPEIHQVFEDLSRKNDVCPAKMNGSPALIPIDNQAKLLKMAANHTLCNAQLLRVEEYLQKQCTFSIYDDVIFLIKVIIFCS